ncbi:MAG TPA: DUF4270 family protein, partial [Ferruginibacter sp.]|nr:DUF4270 family protein [Ferruginibacter sp.]
TIPVFTTQGVFSPDTTVVTRTDDHAIGHTIDPLFGETTAGAYFQLKPAFFPYYLGNPYDTISTFGGQPTGFDSVILNLKYRGYYGDTLQPLDLEVREVVDNGFRDNVNTPNPVNYKPTVGNLIGSTTVTNVSRLSDTVHFQNHKDYTVGTIRIKLDQLWAARLFSQDSVRFHNGINAFNSDSTFRRGYNGLAVLPKQGGQGNQLIYVSLADPQTRLEIHFRRKNGGPVDTVFNTLILNSDNIGTPTFRSSNTANNIVRVRPGLPSGDQELYLQTNPGTYANLHIPGLNGMTNRIIHRAELIVQQIPDLTGYQNIFKAPNYLYLDLKDTGTVARWKPIYFDLNPNATYDPDYTNPFSIPYFPGTGVDYFYFGGYRRDKTDQFGNPISFYNFNISKYVQNIVTNHKPSYDMRLMAPFSFSYPQYAPRILNYGNKIANGRVKVGGGANTAGYKMILRIVYSNI